MGMPRGFKMERREVKCACTDPSHGHRRPCGVVHVRAQYYHSNPRCPGCKELNRRLYMRRRSARERLQSERYRLLMRALGWRDVAFVPNYAELVARVKRRREKLHDQG